MSIVLSALVDDAFFGGGSLVIADPMQRQDG
jgi:hypothetical protein